MDENSVIAAQKVLDEIERGTFGEPPVSLDSEEATARFTADLDKRKEGKTVGLPWPVEWPGLNRKVGLLEPASLTMVGARPSVGKTMFGMQLQRSLCSKGFRVLFVSRELSVVRLIRRQVASYKADMRRMQSGNLEERDFTAFDSYLSESKGWQVYYDETSRTVNEIRAEAEKRPVDIIIIDYLQRLAYDTEQEYAAISRIANELQDLTRQTDVPVVCLTQLSRPLKGMEWKFPSMSDIRGSGAVEERAANIIILHRHWDTETEEKFGKEVKVAKTQSSNGYFCIEKCADGEAGSKIPVEFEGPRFRIIEKGLAE